MRKNILLVEDDISFAKSEQELLEGLGHSVEVCPTAKASVSRLLDERFDIIVLDLSLGNSALEGMEIIQSIRKMAVKVPPIVITSGHDRALIEWAAAKIQTSHWIQKPFSGAQLASVIAQATGGAGDL